MKETLDLPEDVATLQDMVHLAYEEIDILREQVRSLKHYIFGPKSEVLHRDVAKQQPSLFELDPSDAADPDPDEDDESQEPPKPAAKRRRGGRRPLPDSLPREEVIQDVSQAEKMCSCGHEKACIGKDSIEVLERQPRPYYVKVQSRLKYACKNPDCEAVLLGEAGTVTIAKPFPRMIPKSQAGHSLLVHVASEKFIKGLPLYRIEKQFIRDGLTVSRQTMSHWMLTIGRKMKKLEEILLAQAKTHPYLQMDETPFQVLGEDGRKNKTKSYLWAIRGGPPDQPIILFRYEPTRSSDVVREWLANYKGIVQTDGYKGYDFLDEEAEVTPAACWVHARRKFVRVVEAAGKKGKQGRAYRVLKVIKTMYQFEREYQGRPAPEIAAMRQERIRPMLEALLEDLEDLKVKAPPKGLLGQAVSYTLNLWNRLQVFLDHGEMKPDTNAVENTIRPFVVGRKAWLFAGSPAGAKASATIYGLVETAKANGWNPSAWMAFIFDRLPLAETPEELEALLPTKRPPEQNQI